MPRHKLTDAFLRSVKPPTSGQTEYWDTLTPGFGVRVSYGGRKAFGVLTRINGKLHRFTIGSYPKHVPGGGRGVRGRSCQEPPHQGSDTALHQQRSAAGVEWQSHRDHYE